jgi:glyoxylate reductase
MLAAMQRSRAIALASESSFGLGNPRAPRARAVKLAVTARLPVDVAARIARIAPGLALELLQSPTESGRLSLDEVAAFQPDGLVCLLLDRIDAAFLDRVPGLRVVANVAVGLDNVDVDAATARGVCVTNTPDVLTEATAEMAIALLFAAARRIGEGDRLVRAAAWRGWSLDLLLGVPIAGATLGIVGMGRIGRRVARLGSALGLRLCYVSPRPIDPSDLGDGISAEHLPLDELLSRADFVSLHCPLCADTRDLIDRRALARMKPTAVLVNTARGELLDEDALCDQLEAGALFAAGLDVFRNEPRVSPRLSACERIVLAPHLGSATTKARTHMAELAIDAAVSVLRGQRPRTLVNPDVWPEGRPHE